MIRAAIIAAIRLCAALAAAAAFAGCVQMPPTPADIQAKRFDTADGMSVIYILRDIPDHNDLPATIYLDDTSSLTTYPGTYYRWEVPPGRHRISGFGPDVGRIDLQTEPARIYYVQQWVSPSRTYGTSFFKTVDEQQGRSVVVRSKLVP